METGTLVHVGTRSTGRIVWVGRGEWDGYCTVAWGGGFTLERIDNLRPVRS